jgi:tyrosine-protein kinase Etk/Wzc
LPDPEFFREEETLDIKKFLFRIQYNWWWFALSFFVCLTIAYLVNRYSEEIYQASSSVIVANENTPVSDIETLVADMTKTRNQQSKALVQNEITILKSYKMARLAIEQLDFGITYTMVGRRGIAELILYHQSPFVVIPDTLNNNRLNYPVNITILSSSQYRLEIDDEYKISRVMYFGEVFKHKNFNFMLLPRRPEIIKKLDYFPQKYYFIMNDINGLSNKYRKQLNVTVNDDKGSILILSLKGPNREQICDYLNKLSDVYIESNLIDKNITSSNTIRFINGQLKEIIDSLRLTGFRQQNFLSVYKIVDISQEGNTLYKQFELLNTEKAKTDITSSYFDYIKKYVESKKDNSDIVAPAVMGIQDPLLNALVLQINILNTKKRELQFSVNQSSSVLNEVNEQIENVRRDLNENLENLIQSNNITTLSLNRRIASLEMEIQKLPSTERQLINIRRDFNINDKIYTFLLQKRAEAGITKASNAPDNQRLDMAMPENAIRIKPTYSINYMMALAIGGILPLILLILIEYFNSKIVDKNVIEQLTSAPLLGSVGHNEKLFELPVFENPKSALAESFRALRANLQYFMKSEKNNVIAVSSTVSGEGKTFCAANLAAILAMAGRKTLLVSLDLRKPKVHRIFKLDNSTGISSYLAGITSLEKVIFPTNIQNLFVAVSGPVPPNPAELIESAPMMNFINSLKQQYDYIIIDTPPVAIVTDALLLKEMVDIYVFVVRHGFSDKQVLKLIENLYTKRGITNLALLVNDVLTKGYFNYNSSYGYGYGYGYGYEHGYYDEESKTSTLSFRIFKFLKKNNWKINA